jgi:hypothetical protein
VLRDRLISQGRKIVFMGSMGTSPKLSGYAEAQKQLNTVANPETPAAQETAQAALTPNSAFIQVDRVEQLLAQLEAKSLALVPYGHWNPPQAQAKRSNNWVIAAVLGCIWLSSLALAVAYFSYRHPSQIAERDLSATPFVVSSPSDQQDQKTSESVNQLTKALLNSSNRLNQIEAVLQKSNLDLQQLKAKVGSKQSETVSRHPETVPVEINAANTSARIASRNTAVTMVANEATALPPKPSLNPASVQAPPKTTYEILSVKPTDTAIPHKTDDGTIDYWLVARGVFKELSRVQPIAITAEGVVIHNLGDGKNYTLTRQGEWRNAEW